MAVYEIIIAALEACGRSVYSCPLNVYPGVRAKYDYLSKDLNEICAHVGLTIEENGDVVMYVDDVEVMTFTSANPLLKETNKKKLYTMLTAMMLDA